MIDDPKELKRRINIICSPLYSETTGEKNQLQAVAELSRIAVGDCVEPLLRGLQSNHVSVRNAAFDALNSILSERMSTVDDELLKRLKYVENIRRVKHHAARFRMSAGEEYWQRAWDETVYSISLERVRTMATTESERRWRSRNEDNS
jgi:HEAT repeat protein